MNRTHATAVFVCLALMASGLAWGAGDALREIANFPAWRVDGAVYEAAAAIERTPDLDPARLSRWAASPNALIARAAADRLAGRAPQFACDGKRAVTAEFFGQATLDGRPLPLELDPGLLAVVAEGPRTGDETLASARAARLTAGYPILTFTCDGSAAFRLWPDGRVVGVDPSAWIGEAALAELENAWLLTLAAPGQGDAEHFARLAVLLAGNHFAPLERQLLELAERRPDTPPVLRGDLDLALFLFYQGREPARAREALARLVNEHTEHPYVRRTGFLALAHLYVGERDWLAYRNLWNTFGAQLFGELPAGVADRIVLIDKALAAEILWERGPAAQDKVNILEVVDALEHLPDYDRTFLWLERYLSENPTDEAELLRKGRTLIKLMRFDDAEKFLLANAENAEELPTYRLKFYEMLVNLYKIRNDDAKRLWAGEKWSEMRDHAQRDMDANVRPDRPPPPPPGP
jgi:hypothetical protein